MIKLLAKLSLLSFFLVTFVSCARHDIKPQSSQAPVQLTRAAKIYVSIPKDGKYYENKPYVGSGKMVAAALVSELGKYADKVFMGVQAENMSQAILTAQKLSTRYLFFTKILHWEDRATEWSGKPDRLEIQVKIVEVSNKHLLDQTILTGNSSFFTLGGDHPQDMLPKIINDYTVLLFKGNQMEAFSE